MPNAVLYSKGSILHTNDFSRLVRFPIILVKNPGDFWHEIFYRLNVFPNQQCQSTEEMQDGPNTKQQYI